MLKQALSQTRSFACSLVAMKPGTTRPGRLPCRYPRITEASPSSSIFAATRRSWRVSASRIWGDSGKRVDGSAAGRPLAAPAPDGAAGPTARTASVTSLTTLTHLLPSEAETQEKCRRRGSSPTNSISALKVAKRRRAYRLPCT